MVWLGGICQKEDSSDRAEHDEPWRVVAPCAPRCPKMPLDGDEAWRYAGLGAKLGRWPRHVGKDLMKPHVIVR